MPQGDMNHFRMHFFKEKLEIHLHPYHPISLDICRRGYFCLSVAVHVHIDREA